jgi:CDP-6-deoxy-D-xylo-4-hexulose-3-dehydrase
MTGNLAHAGAFSFYFGHHISTIEGGAVTTNDPDLLAVMRSIRSHGWSRDVPNEVRDRWRGEHEVDEFRDLYTFYFPGFNLRSTEVNAFLGLSQLKSFPAALEARSKNFAQYRERLSDYWHQESEHDTLSSFAYGTFVENRLETYRHLRSAGIESRPLICGSMGRQPFWIERFGETRLAVADRVHDHGIYLPNHAHLSSDDIDAADMAVVAHAPWGDAPEWVR